MLKKGFRVVAIQLIGLVLNIISMYVLVGGMDPATYALVGIYNTIMNLVIAFGQVGIESIITRNALFWNEHEKRDTLVEYITQALSSRVIIYVASMPAVLGYLSYLNIEKYNGMYAGLFLFYTVSLLSKSLVDCARLILKALGKYELSQIVDITNQTIIKIVGIVVFISFGAMAYLYVFAGVPILIAFVLLIYLKKYIDFRYIKVKAIWEKIKETKYLLIGGYVNYFRQSADSLLVSILFPAEIMGSYSIFKSLEQMLRSIIEGFFDTITQEIIRLKGEYKKMCVYEKKVMLVRRICILVGLGAFAVFFYLKDPLIKAVRLDQYQFISVMVISVVLMELCYVIGKVEINIVSLIAPPKNLLYINILIIVFTFVSYIIMIFSNDIYIVMLQRIGITLVNSIIYIAYYKKNKVGLYEKSGEAL